MQAADTPDKLNLVEPLGPFLLVLSMVFKVQYFSIIPLVKQSRVVDIIFMSAN